MSKPLTNDQIESIKQEMYDCSCDLEVVIYMFETYLCHARIGIIAKHHLVIFYQGIVDYLTYPRTR